jgi:hypothetical protein
LWDAGHPSKMTHYGFVGPELIPGQQRFCPKFGPELRPWEWFVWIALSKQ